MVHSLNGEKAFFHLPELIIKTIKPNVPSDIVCTVQPRVRCSYLLVFNVDFFVSTDTMI